MTRLRSTLTVGAMLACSIVAAVLWGAPALGATPDLAKPNPPQGVSAQVASHQLTVSWLVFSDDGWGGPIDNYQVTAITPAGQVLTQYSTMSPVTFTELRHGTYSYYVGAHNAAGWGHVSATASVVVPSEPDRLAVPHASSETPDTLTVTWNGPGSDGESPVTGFQVRFDGELHDESATARSATFPAAGGTRHTVQVRAANRWGFGAFSGTHYAHALGTPGPPAAVTATATRTTVAVRWTPPDNDGGRTIDHYRVRVFSGSYSQQTSATDHAELGGLTPGNHYFVQVAAVGYDPDDGLGVLTGPEYGVEVHTAAVSDGESSPPTTASSTAASSTIPAPTTAITSSSTVTVASAAAPTSKEVTAGTKTSLTKTAVTTTTAAGSTASSVTPHRSAAAEAGSVFAPSTASRVGVVTPGRPAGGPSALSGSSAGSLVVSATTPVGTSEREPGAFDAPDPGMAGWPWWGGGALLLLGVGAGVLVWRRRSGRSS